MKGIILAGGTGSRLFPITKAVSKHVLPVYDKPMIYYPLSVLMLADIQNILIITTEEDLFLYKRLLKNGEDFGLNITYEVQKKPEGIAQAFIIGKNFIGNDRVCLILGDNIFWGQGFSDILKSAIAQKNGATVFGYQVKDPHRFGVIEFDKNKKVISIEEKPKLPKSNYILTGLYFYDNNIINLVNDVSLSSREEFEITSINKIYLKHGDLNVQVLGRGFAWLDTGTHQSLLEASSFVETIEKRQGFKIACLEEIGWKKGWIDDNHLLLVSDKYGNSNYGSYLRNLLNFK